VWQWREARDAVAACRRHRRPRAPHRSLRGRPRAFGPGARRAGHPRDDPPDHLRGGTARATGRGTSATSTGLVRPRSSA
jgi:hypothetical protein